MRKIDKTIVPRNPYALAAKQKKAGKHVDTQKTERQKSKQDIRQELDFKKVNEISDNTK